MEKIKQGKEAESERVGGVIRLERSGRTPLGVVTLQKRSPKGGEGVRHVDAGEERSR